jgi:uncharacterized protein (TIRG00374 family)
LAAIFVVGIFSHIFRAIRWNLLIGSMGYKTNTVRTFYAVMIGYLANLAIPRIGEVTRCGILSKSENIPVNSLIGTVISERIFDMLVLIIITFMVILFQLDLLGGFVHKYIVGPLTSGVLHNKLELTLIVAFFLILVILSVYTFRKFKYKIKHLALYQKITLLVSGFLTGILSIKKLKKKGWFLVHTIIIWFMYFLMTYLCFFSLPATSHLGIAEGLTVLSLGSFGIVAPVPGGIGAYHFIVKAILFELYGVVATSAASFATVSHFIQTLLIIIGGAISYFMIIIYLKRKTIENN